MITKDSKVRIDGGKGTAGVVVEVREGDFFVVVTAHGRELVHRSLLSEA